MDYWKVGRTLETTVKKLTSAAPEISIVQYTPDARAERRYFCVRAKNVYDRDEAAVLVGRLLKYQRASSLSSNAFAISLDGIFSSVFLNSSVPALGGAASVICRRPTPRTIRNYMSDIPINPDVATVAFIDVCVQILDIRHTDGKIPKLGYYEPLQVAQTLVSINSNPLNMLPYEDIVGIYLLDGKAKGAENLITLLSLKKMQNNTTLSATLLVPSDQQASIIEIKSALLQGQSIRGHRWTGSAALSLNASETLMNADAETTPSLRLTICLFEAETRRAGLIVTNRFSSEDRTDFVKVELPFMSIPTAITKLSDHKDNITNA